MGQVESLCNVARAQALARKPQHLPLAVTERVRLGPGFQRQLRIDRATTAMHRAQRLGQLLGRCILEQVAAHARIERAPQETRARERGHDDDLAGQRVALHALGQFQAGVRSNIIPENARLVGTIRTFDEGMRDDVHARLRRIAESVAAAHGASAMVKISRGYPVTANDAELVGRMRPTLERVAPGRVLEIGKLTVAEDFSFFANRVPGLYFMLGVTPADQVATAAANHSPKFEIDESALVTGVRALAHLTADTLFAGSPSR